jgi:hypothetical protein
VLRRRLISVLCVLGLLCGLVTALPQAASAAAQPDTETSALLSVVERFAVVGKGLARVGPMGEELPLVGLVPGGEDGLGLDDLFQVAVYDQLKNLTSLSGIEDEYPLSGPRAGRLLAKARPWAGSGTST